jgi:hypothetical protein
MKARTIGPSDVKVAGSSDGEDSSTTGERPGAKA